VFWLLPSLLVIGAVGFLFLAALDDRDGPAIAGIVCAVAAVVVTFSHVTHGHDVGFVWWVVMVLGCLAIVGLLVGLWWQRWQPAASAGLCLIVTGVLVATNLSGPTETRPIDPHPDAAFRVVAIGDSYMAGEGAPQYFPGTDEARKNRCHRAATAYPYVVTDELDDSLLFAACSAARTDDVIGRGQFPRSDADVIGGSPQLKVLRDELQKAGHVGAVLVSIGGNDAGFAEIGTACAVPGERDCRHSANYWVKRLEDQVLPALVDTYTQIRDAANGAPVFVLTYPNPIGPRYCRDIELDRGELAFVRDVFVGRLDELIRFAARKARVRVINLEDALEGRRFCEVRLSKAAINFIALGRTRGTTADLSVAGIVGLAHGTFHPNVLGHQLMAKEVRSAVDAARAGQLEPLPPPAEPDERPPPPRTSGVDPPVGPHDFPEGSRCAGPEISVTTPMSLEPKVKELALDHVRAGSIVCFHRSGDPWHATRASAGGTAKIRVDVSDPGIGSINEVLVQEEAGTWKELVVSRVVQPGDDLEPPKPSYLGFILVSVALAAVLIAAVAIRLFKLHSEH
jgi:hypothetical protein